MSKLLFSEKMTPSQQQKVVEVCNRLGIHPNWLIGVMNFESGLNPRATNPISGSVGLIQFTRDKAGVNYKTINGKQYKLTDLKAMTFEQQMEVVYEYLKPFASKIKSFIDCYMVVFFPVATGKPDSYVFQTSNLSASLIAKQNPAFDGNGDKQITKAEVLDFFRKRYAEVFPQLNVSKGEGWFTVLLFGVAVFFYTAFAIGF